jgi:hypothetical protein
MTVPTKKKPRRARSGRQRSAAKRSVVDPNIPDLPAADNLNFAARIRLGRAAHIACLLPLALRSLNAREGRFS